MSVETLETIFNVMVYVFVFLFGVTIGSFLNVCIYRLPKGESLTANNSHCMTCGAQIKRYDLIPILSWLILRGKCRNCGAKISPRYLIVESLTGIMFVLCYAFFPVAQYQMYFVLLCLFISGLIVLAFQDHDNQEMCVSVLIYTFIIAVLTHILSYIKINGGNALVIMPEGLKDCLIGAVSVSGVLLIVGFVFTPLAYILFLSQDHKDLRRLERALKSETNERKRGQLTVKIDKTKAKIKETGPVFGFGMGDVIVMAEGGLMLGWKAAVTSGIIAIILGAVYAIYKAAVGNDDEENTHQFAFGPFIIIGLVIGAFFGNELVDAYLSYMML
ncbi:MAG: prepilin peptidase [Oscillospiraceae bacterium]